MEIKRKMWFALQVIPQEHLATAEVPIFIRYISEVSIGSLSTKNNFIFVTEINFKQNIA